MVCVCECIRRVGCVLYTVPYVGHVPYRALLCVSTCSELEYFNAHTMPPVIGWDDSTAVGISVWSPASGARVGGCLQSECVSER